MVEINRMKLNDRLTKTTRTRTARKVDALAFILQLMMLFICNKTAFVSATRSHTYSLAVKLSAAQVSAFQFLPARNANLLHCRQHQHSLASPPFRCSYDSSVFQTYSPSRLLSIQTNEDAVDGIGDSSVEISPSYDVILNGLNSAQAQAVTQPLESITRVVAGPGAGKTRVLICRIAYLLKKDNVDEYGKRNSRILAVTFTKKAASEMQHRLDSILREDEDYQNQLAACRAPEVNEEDDEIYEEVVQSDNSVTRSGDSSSSMITRVSLGTFHSICAKILRWNGSELGKLPSIQHYKPKGMLGDILDSSFAIIDQNEQMRIIKQCLTDAGVVLKGSGRGQADIRPITILNAVGQLKSDDAMEAGTRSKGEEESAGMKMTSKVRRIAEEVYPLYRTALLSQNSVDFDDLILLTRELLKTNIDVRDRMSKRWQHILVDEFQDTSEVQLDLVKLLSRDSLLIVGDGDQSIYSWRGAHAESMSDFVHKFEEAKKKKVDTVFLMENYRSTTNIVKAAQKVISGDKSSGNTNASIRQDMKPMRGRGPSPRVLACADAKAEATFVVKEILKMEREGLLDTSSTLALIYRTNAQSRALEEACVEHNLKYLIRGSAGTFYSRAEIKDCLCFLRWIYNGRDRSAMARAMKTPSRGLGDVSLNEFTTYCEEVTKHVAANDPDGPQPTPLDILLSLSKTGQGDDRSYLPPDGVITKRTWNKLLPFAIQMNKLSRKAQSQSVTELLGSIIEIMSLKNHFDAISKTSDEFADRWANVMELLNASERYTQDGACMEKKQVEVDGELQIEEMSPLGNFLDDVSLLTETEAADEGENGERRLLANLMTIHASKGMEFDAVCLVGNEESTFPTQRAIMEGEGSVELDEERRLCYVAMTRAKTHLIMTWRKEVTTFFGQGFKVSKSERSRFLDALMSKKDVDKGTTSQSKMGTSKLTQHESGSMQKPRIRKVKKTSRTSFTSTRDSDPLAIPLPKKKVVKRKVSTSRLDADHSRRTAKKMLQSNADAREEKEKWANYHANKNRSATSGKAIRSDTSPKLKSTRGTTASANERGRRALSTTSSIKPRGDAKTGIIKPPQRKRSTPSRANPLREKKRPESDVAQIPEMDSTMFFPLGSGVNHVLHGEGKVVKPSLGQDAQTVHVKFENGMQMDFPIGFAGLAMKY
jgi:DNA helicase-2/ATP-dependent DNA helicase PcrA